MDWEGEGERETVRVAVTIDVSDQVHLEATLSKPKHSSRMQTSASSGGNNEEGAEDGGEVHAGRAPQQQWTGLKNAKVGIVITHPHPMLGGNMHNNVVVGLFKRFAAEGFCVVRFNFRGTGRSTGSKTWRGSGEREDVVAVCRFLQSECGVEAVYLVGYSYGSAIGCSVVNDVDIIKGCIAVSYPFGVLTWILLGHLLNMAKTRKPCLWVIGTDDNFTAVSRFRQSVKELALLGLAEEEDFEKKRRSKRNKNSRGDKDDHMMMKNNYTMEYFKNRRQTTAVVHGVDHFWFDEEDILSDIAVAWVQARLRDEIRPPASGEDGDEEGEGEEEEEEEEEEENHSRRRHRQKDDLVPEENHSKL